MRKFHKKDRLTKGSQKGLQIGGGFPKLTKKQSEVLHLLSDEFKTIKEISLSRKTSRQAVHKIVKKLKEKGLINRDFKKVDKSGGTLDPFIKQNPNSDPLISHGIRLHGQEFNIRILERTSEYENIRKKGNKISFDHNTIKLYKDTLEVYSNKSFIGETPSDAYKKGLDYWKSFFIKLENQFKILIVKDRVHNIKEVKSHYSETNNELAKDCNKNREKIRIKADEDNKTWFVIDNSFNLHEAETIHPETSKNDMERVIQPFFKDLRQGDYYLSSEVKTILNQLVNTQIQQTLKLNKSIELVNKSIELENKLAINIKEHLKLVKKLNKAVDWVNEEKKYLRKLKGQKTLSDF